MIEIETDYGPVAVWSNDSVIVNRMLEGKLFEQDEVERYFAEHVRGARTILDIGGHVGSHSLMYHRFNPEATILVFEPQRRMFELLQRNIVRNCDPDRVRAVCCALGHRVGTARMSSTVLDGPSPGVPIEYGSSRGHNLGGLSLGDDGEIVEMRTVDSLGLTSCDFIKIDVEGFEPLVILGAQATIRRFRPVICFEQNDKTVTDAMLEFFELDRAELRTTSELLEALGYEVAPIASDSENMLALPG